MIADRYYDYTISVMLLTHHGILKPDREYFEFRFCAESKDHAIVLAGANVKSKGYPHQEVHVEITNAIPVCKPILSDQCQDNEHGDCVALWCGCEHHQFEMAPLVGKPIRSCAEMESEREEQLEVV